MSIALVWLSIAAPAPFAVASGAEWSGEHARLFPLLHEAGVAAVRSFPEWAGIQPERDAWHFEAADALIASARDNQIEIVGLFHYLAPWASSAPETADHGARTRTFPVRDLAAWREFVRRTSERYRNDVRCWEVYNEFNSPGFAREASVEDYVGLVRAAREATRAVDPELRIGIGCADVDVSFLGRVIEGGARGQFDFINVHPYSLMDAAMAGREGVFLRLGENLRKLFAQTGQEPVPVWVSEIGRPAHDEPGEERRQAEAVIKAYALCLAQGIERVFWFEGRGPAYGDSGDFGLVRADWSLRPSYRAFQTMTRLLGPTPRYAGWHNPTGASYGFLFEGADGPVLIAWAAAGGTEAWWFEQPVTVTTIDGAAVAGPTVALSSMPVFVTGLPGAVVDAIRAHGEAPFPWLKDFATAPVVSCVMGAANVEEGVAQLDRGDGMTTLALVDGVHARRTDMARGMPYMYFDVDDSFASVGDATLDVTIVARRVDPGTASGTNLVYESATGYRNLGEWWTVPDGPGWHEHTFHVTDANFANNWGWNFRLELPGSPGDIWVREVRVSK